MFKSYHVALNGMSLVIDQEEAHPQTKKSDLLNRKEKKKKCETNRRILVTIHTFLNIIYKSESIVYLLCVIHCALHNA